MKRDLLAGALLVNVIPHAVVGLGGHTCLTPLAGEDSSPRINLLWAGLNLAGAIALLGSARWRSLDAEAASRRRIAVEIGGFAMTTFGMIYELTGGRRKRRT